MASGVGVQNFQSLLERSPLPAAKKGDTEICTDKQFTSCLLASDNHK